MERFYLKGLKSNIIQYDSSFNFDDLIAFYQRSLDTLQTDTTGSGPVHFQLSNIELVYFNDREIEKQQIAVDMARKLFVEKTGKDFRNDGRSFISFLGLETKMEHDSMDIGEASEKLIEASAIDQLMARIENSRRSNIEEYLSRVSDSSGIRVFAPDAKSPKNTGAKPTFEVKYTMKREGRHRE